MKTTRLFVLTFIIAACAVVSFGQSARVADLSDRLVDEATRLADTTYRDYTSGYRNGRTEVEAMLLTQQFRGAAEAFQRLVQDRRRNSELRDAAAVLQEISRTSDRNYQQRTRWSDVQRIVSDLVRELGVGTPGFDPFPRPTDPNRASGRMTWKGRVDHDVQVVVRGRTAEVLVLSGTPYYNATYNFTSAVPRRRVTVSLNVKKGRGEVALEQQPSEDNDYTVVIRIKDSKGGASDYEFEIFWQ